jgi:hypothetical protein
VKGEMSFRGFFTFFESAMRLGLLVWAGWLRTVFEKNLRVAASNPF